MNMRRILLRSYYVFITTSVIITACAPHTFTPSPTTHQTTVSVKVSTGIVTPTRIASSTTTPPIAPAVEVSPSTTPQVGNDQTVPSEFVYFFDGVYLEYAVINYLALKPNGVSLPPKILPLGIGQALFTGFSNFANRLWYLKVRGSVNEEDLPRDLWLSDLLGKENTHIFTETNQTRIENLWWTPEDQHLIIKIKYPPNDGFIYHVQTGGLDDWPYNCSQVALSPRSNRLVLWCQPSSVGKEFAVIEWDGEIWFSREASNKIIVHGINWVWSENGKRLAYSTDGIESDGNLIISDEVGYPIRTIPGIMSWIINARHKPLNPALQWSANGQRLVILSPGVEEKSCPPDEYNWYIDGPDRNPPCWHVYDVTTGKMIWDLPDSIEEPGVFESNDFEHVAISGDGRYLALGVNGLDDQHRGIWVIDLDTHKTVWSFGVWIPTTIRWGPAFNADFSFPN
jgi:hypothetical protein